MRIAHHWLPLPLVAALIAGCSGLADPDDRAPSPGEGDSMSGLGSGDDEPNDDPSSPGQRCEVAGLSFPDGANVPSGDGCTRCACDDGSVVCNAVTCEPVACDVFVETSDGVCSRMPLDPCIFQDPDCSASSGARSCEAAGQTFPDGAAVPSGDSCNTCSCDDGSVFCTEIACEPVGCDGLLEAPDGVCSRLPLDPCISQDPDCSNAGAGSCEAAAQTFDDGAEVPSGDSCNTCSCSDGSIACTELTCDTVFCAEFVEASDGLCSRFPLDPCLSQDPDCGSGGAACEAAGEVFPAGSDVPSGDSCNTCSCSDGSVICTEIACEPVACDLYLEAPDGTCSRFPLDPCISQDPDCAGLLQPLSP